MPSTFSTDLKLTLQANGENVGTWGTITNTNLGTLLEQATVRSGAVAMSDATTTISISDGASSPARCFVLALSGALTAQRDLVVPTINKPYIVVNNTTGGFGVQVKTVAGTGIVVPNGKRRFLYANGTNVVEMIDSITGLAVSGALTGGTLTVGGFTVAPGGNIATAGALTLSGAFGTTLTVTATTSITLPITGTLSTLAGAETLTNKTLTSPVVTGGTFASPVMTTPTLGVATATSVNKVAITAPAASATLTIANTKTLTVSNTLTLAGTDASTLNIGTGGTLGTAAYTATTAYTPSTAAFQTAAYVSPDTSYTAASAVTLAHGLGSARLLIQVMAVCTSNDSGYITGDVVIMASAQTTESFSYNIQVRFDATNIVVNVAQGGLAIVGNAAPFISVALDQTKWKLRVSAFKYQ